MDMTNEIEVIITTSIYRIVNTVNLLATSLHDETVNLRVERVVVIMVAPDENNVTIQLLPVELRLVGCSFTRLAANGISEAEVAEKYYDVFWLYSGIPVPDKGLIHVLDIPEGSACIFYYVGMPKVSVACEPRTCH